MVYDKTVLPDMMGAKPDCGISLVRFDPGKEMGVLRVCLQMLQPSRMPIFCVSYM